MLGCFLKRTTVVSEFRGCFFFTVSFVFFFVCLVSDEILCSLHSVFGDVLMEATVLLEASRVVVFEAGIRRVYKLMSREDCFAFAEGIGFCFCEDFLKVVRGETVVCKHLLALKLAIVMGLVSSERITDNQMITLLNEQLDCFEEGR